MEEWLKRMKHSKGGRDEDTFENVLVCSSDFTGCILLDRSISFLTFDYTVANSSQYCRKAFVAGPGFVQG
jgi:hypothetical protein